MSANQKVVEESQQYDTMQVEDYENIIEEIKKFNNEAALAIIDKHKRLHPLHILDFIIACLDTKFPKPLQQLNDAKVKQLLEHGLTSEQIDKGKTIAELDFAKNQKTLDEGENRNLVVLERLLSLINIKRWECFFMQKTLDSACIAYVLKFSTQSNKEIIKMHVQLLIKHGAIINNNGMPGWFSIFDNTAAIRELFDIETEKHQALGAGILTAFENSADGNAVSGFINKFRNMFQPPWILKF